jgi:putative transcriptional regulator
VKAKDFNHLAKSIKQAGKIRRGQTRASRVFTIKPADIKSIRLNLEKSQSKFALMIGVSVATLRNWEQGRRVPEGPARALLKVASQNPWAVAEASGT